MAVLVAAVWAVMPTARAQKITGPDWVVCFNLPTQKDAVTEDGEYAIRDLLIGGIDRLEEGHHVELATFTLSGNSLETGKAGPLLAALSRALDRGVPVHFVAANIINLRREFRPGLSLSRLARRRKNPMRLSVAPDTSLMHHKAALFDYGKDDKWTFVGSGNFTGAASVRQWNIATLLRNADLFDAFSFEMAEFRAGRFGQDKRRDHDGTVFRLEEAWGDCWIRFGPYPGESGGKRSPEAEIIRLVQEAEHEIYFAMHRFNRPAVSRALVAAANRGVRVAGVIPESDRGRAPSAVSRRTARFLANPKNYRGTNRVELLPARASAFEPGWDSGEQDLVHVKYMVVDPDGERPIVVHGPANWTFGGIVSPDANDESILFLRHAGIARAFMQQFHRMTRPPE